MKAADFNDFGEVTLRALALIPVKMAKSAPARQATHPELVAIPGGEFVMVGDYPAGAARDGMMDLAGNVSNGAPTPTAIMRWRAR